MKQVRFYDHDNKAMLGGIQLDDGNVICGCCGGLIEKDEFDGVNYTLCEVYDAWMDLSEAICGDDKNTPIDGDIPDDSD